jgi:hypothetical protein
VLLTRYDIPLTDIARDIALPITFIIYISISYFINYPHPKVDRSIFEQLIQVNVTILGFALVGFLYYYGKFDDKKKEYVRLWSKLVDIGIKSSEDKNKITDIYSDIRL